MPVKVTKLSEKEVVVHSENEDWEQHLHDINGALGRFEAIVASVKAGYQFDDEKAERYTELLSEAVDVIDKHLETIRAIGIKFR